MPPSPKLSPRFYVIVGLLFTASFLNYLDRQTLSVLKPALKTEFHLDDNGYAWVVNVFTLAYALFYIVSGWFVESVGARVALTVGLAGWSLATIGCGLSTTFVAFAAFRGLLGAMEPAYFPSFIRSMTVWAPVKSRARWMSICGAGGTLGAVIAVPLIAILAARISWRAAFWLPGIAGLGLAGAWWLSYREPLALGRSQPQPDQARLPPGQLFSHPALWGICLARFISDPAWYFCMFWMPGYLQEQRGLSLQQAGIIGWIPLLTANVAALAGAALSDRLGESLGSPAKGRLRVVVLAACLGPLAMLIPHLSSTALALAVLSILGAICLNWLFILGPLVSDLFPAGNVAGVWAVAGTFGAVGAAISNYLIGQILTRFGSSYVFLLLGVLHPIAAVVLTAFLRRSVRSRPSGLLQPPFNRPS